MQNTSHTLHAHAYACPSGIGYHICIRKMNYKLPDAPAVNATALSLLDECVENLLGHVHGAHAAHALLTLLLFLQ